MSKKKGLQIRTYQLNDQQCPDRQLQYIIYSPDNSQQKIISASKFQRILSTNLASKFISCWKSLKKLLSSQYKTQLKSTNNQQNRDYQEKNWNYPRIKNDIKGIQTQNYYHSLTDKFRYQQAQQFPHTLYYQKQLVRTKSADLKYQVSRAQILYQIAQKLKKSRKSRQNYENENSQTQIIKRLNKLQNTIKSLKTTERKYITHSVSSRIENNEHNNKPNREIVKMIEQISYLKNDLQFMKKFNHELLQQSLQKSKRQEQLLEIQHSRRANYSPFQKQHSKVIVNHIPPANAPNNIYVYSYPPMSNPISNSIGQSKVSNIIPIPSNINLPPQNQFSRNRVNSYNIRINGIPQSNLTRRIYHQVPNYNQAALGSNGSNINNSFPIDTNRNIYTSHQTNNLYCCSLCGRSCNCPSIQKHLMKPNI